MKYILVLLTFSLLVSCVNRPRQIPQAVPFKFCPGFIQETWEVTQLPQQQKQELLEKQKFAVLPNQTPLWFAAKENYLGLCIPPKNEAKHFTNDCGTIYVIFRKRKELWRVIEQKVTICPE